MNTSRLRLLTAGESHGPELTAILEGLPAGLPIDLTAIDAQLERRQRGYGAGPRMKLEQDRATITAGVLAGRTTGAPLAIRITNRDHAKWRGRPIDPLTTPRPGHVDLTAAVKYGYTDLRPGLERASARETAARVALGAVCRTLLETFGIRIGGYVLRIGDVETGPLDSPYEIRFRTAEQNEVRCPDADTAAKMAAAIRSAIENRDTLGGILETVALGVPPGLGSHVQWDRRLEARIGGAFLSVQAMKGVEFGEAFATTALPGTQAHDALRLEDGRITRPTNLAGGIEGGISNGQPIVVRTAMKPIATTLTPQETVDLATGEETTTRYERSDFCPVPRAAPILEAVLAHVLADALLEKVGGDSMDEIAPRVASLRKTDLEDLPMDGEPHIFWEE
ncbi:MAG TPA: chorismate synthase [Anaerolineales bacterium]|nr:chorismate synthase [Anaerolineales bacterium]